MYFTACSLGGVLLLPPLLLCGCCSPVLMADSKLTAKGVVLDNVRLAAAALQSVFDDLKKELQLRSLANGDLAAEHMETGVLMLGVLTLQSPINSDCCPALTYPLAYALKADSITCFPVKC